MNQPVLTQKATLWERQGAAFVDLLVCWPLVLLPAGIVAAPLLVAERAGVPLPGYVSLPPLLLLLLSPLAYCVWFWLKRGATPGKELLGLRVVSQDGSPLRIGQAVLRCLGYLLSAIFWLGFIAIAFRKDRRGWHDDLASTDVVRVDTPAATWVKVYLALTMLAWCVLPVVDILYRE